MNPERNPNGRVAGKSGRGPKFKEAFTIRFWQPLALQHLLPFIGTFEDVQVEVGVGVSNLCENPPPRGPLGTCGSRLFCFFFLLLLLFRFFVVVFVSAPASASICSLSLSLSLATTSRGLCISLYLLCASPLECPCHKTVTGAKLTAP